MTVQTDSSVFPQDALAANQSGSLTDTQRRRFRSDARSTRKAELVGAGGLLLVAVLLFTSTGHTSAGLWRPVIALGCLVLGVFFLIRSLTGGDAVTRDLRSGKVESVEGAIDKVVYRGKTTDFDYFVVSGKKIKVLSGAEYRAAPDAGFVRVYYLPESRILVNLEVLPDRPLPEGVTPQQVMGEFKDALHSHDRTKVAEASADVAAMRKEMQSSFAPHAVPPSQSSRDPRPLDQAILGTWHNTLLTLTFDSDGTVNGSTIGGLQRSGQWSVDGDGRLRSDITGHGGAADAWVVGDQLTIAAEGEGLTFKRAPSD